MTWNSAEVLGRCLDSLLAQEVRGGFEAIVVDSASADGSVELLRGYSDDRLRVIASEQNLGYSGGNNLAASEARGEVLFFLNPDTELLGTDVLERIAEAAERPGVAIAGPRLVNPDGSLQPSCAGHPSVMRALVMSAGLHRALPDSVRARVVPELWAHDRAIVTDWVMGAAIASRAQVFRSLAGFWPALYMEEADLALRAQRRGMRVLFEPGATVMHIGNHSVAQKLGDVERASTVARSELLFLAQHYPHRRARAIRAIVGTGYALRAVVLALLRRQPRAAVYRAMAGVYARGR